jgi:hypothetical protein
LYKLLRAALDRLMELLLSALHRGGNSLNIPEGAAVQNKVKNIGQFYHY